MSALLAARDATALADLVRVGEISPAQLLEAAIARAEAVNPQINAIVHQMHEAAAEAIDIGLPDGPFKGVPFLLKDLYCKSAGGPVSQGSRIYAEFVAPHDDEIVARYRRAGLAIFGRTASPEFGLSTSTESALHGQTRNPWNLDYAAGGSSGGAAAAVAAGVVPMANASDGGGSIRIPASCCGLFGLKPTRGRTPAGPDIGEGWSGMSNIHAVTRSVRDSAALLDATAGPDLGAPYAAPAPPQPFAESLHNRPRSLRIGLQTEAFNGAEVDPVCVEAAASAAQLCEELGHRVEIIQIRVDREPMLDAGAVLIGANLLATLEARAADLGRALREDDVEPLTWLTADGARARTATDYANALRHIHALGREVAGFLSEYDVLLTPTMAIPPPPLGVLSLSNPDADAFSASLQRTIGFTQLFNMSGNPAMSVPLHWDSNGLPVGVQFAGGYGDESTLFALAAQLEAAAPWAHRLPNLPGIDD
ncbi:MAG: amidase [Gammaproteobacteria bacterium]|nr:amidase [Gammaproteobacteria bacterium]